MRYLVLLIVKLTPFCLFGQTYTTTSQGKNVGYGGAYVPPVITKTYTVKQPVYTPPVRSSSVSYNGNTSSGYSTNNGSSKSTPPKIKIGNPYKRSDYSLENELNPVADYGKWGYADISGKIIIPFAFSEANYFYEDRAVVILNNKHTFIDTKGNQLMPFIYDSCLKFSNGMGAVKKNGLWGYVNNSGTLVIANLYTTATPFSQEFACVKSGELYGYIDKTGETVIPFAYSIAQPFSEGLARVGLTRNGIQKSGFIEHSGNSVVPLKYEDARDFHEGMAAVKINGKWGFIDDAAKEVIDFRYDEVWWFSEGLAAVREEKEGMWSFIDRRGKEIMGKLFKDARCFSEGLAAVKINGFYGFINHSGEMIIPATLDMVFGCFENGFVPVLTKDLRIVAIDKKGKEVNQ